MISHLVIRPGSDASRQAAIRVELPVAEPLLFDKAVWFGEVNLETLGVVPSNDPRSVVLNGVFNLANRADGVVVVTGAAFECMPIEAKRMLWEVIVERTIPLPQPIGEPSVDRVPFAGMIELPEDIRWPW